MEKFAALSKLGIKYLFRYRKRYGFLFAALVFCFAIVTFITSVKDGMYENVYYSAQAHYAGDIIAVGTRPFFPIDYLEEAEAEKILEAINEVPINYTHILQRTIFGDRGIVFFNGNAILQKYIIGCDWENEAHLFNQMEFTFPLDENIGDNSIVLSEPVANELGASMGDIIILEVDTIWGQKNTEFFTVSGIVRDFSLFGYYKVYVSRTALNRMLLISDDDCSLIGIFTETRRSAETYRVMLQEALSSKLAVGELASNRDEILLFRDNAIASWQSLVFLYTMPVFLSEISSLLDALNLLTYFLYSMMLIIIVVSAAVTYRLILHERAKEMGVMRAIGFYGADLRHVLWVEVFALGIISLTAGFALAYFLSKIGMLFSFSWFPSFEIFLKNGRLSALYLPQTVIFNIAITLLVLALAVFFPSLLASKKKLTSLLSGEVL